MGIQKQEIQDSGGGVWPNFAHRNGLRRVQDTYNYKMKPRICIYTSWTEVLFIFYVPSFDLPHIKQKHCKNVKLGFECKASTKTQQI